MAEMERATSAIARNWLRRRRGLAGLVFQLLCALLQRFRAFTDPALQGGDQVLERIGHAVEVIGEAGRFRGKAPEPARGVPGLRR